jgi:release factor glutamine methyltransferase
MTTVGELLARAAEDIRRERTEATPWDARILLAHTLGRGNPLSLPLEGRVSESTLVRFDGLWQLRLTGVPVQHLDERGLIPRPETEVLVLQAIAAAPNARRILDLGTGSGIIAISLLQELHGATAVALDLSLAALALARENAIRQDVLSRIRLAASDWLSALRPEPFDLVVSNPPYLARKDADALSRTVVEHDPEIALFGGEDGLESVLHLLDAVAPFAAPGAPFLFEIGFGQARDTEREARSRPAWIFEGIAADLSGIPRVARLRRA